MSITPEDLKRQMAEQQAKFEKQLADSEAQYKKLIDEEAAAHADALKRAQVDAQKAQTDLDDLRRQQDNASRTISERTAELEKQVATVVAERDQARREGKRADLAVTLFPIYKDEDKVEAAMLMAEKHGLIDYSGDAAKIDADKLQTIFKPSASSPAMPGGVNPGTASQIPDLSKALATRNVNEINAAWNAQLKMIQDARAHRGPQLPGS